MVFNSKRCLLYVYSYIGCSYNSSKSAFLCFCRPVHSQNSPNCSSSRLVCVSLLNVLNCRKVVSCCFVVFVVSVCFCLSCWLWLPATRAQTVVIFLPQNGFPLIRSLICLVLFAPTVNLSNFTLEVLTVGENPCILHITIHQPPKAAGLTVFTFSLHSRPSVWFEV